MSLFIGDFPSFLGPWNANGNGLNDTAEAPASWQWDFANIGMLPVLLGFLEKVSKNSSTFSSVNIPKTPRSNL